MNNKFKYLTSAALLLGSLAFVTPTFANVMPPPTKKPRLEQTLNNEQVLCRKRIGKNIKATYSKTENGYRITTFQPKEKYLSQFNYGSNKQLLSCEITVDGSSYKLFDYKSQTIIEKRDGSSQEISIKELESKLDVSRINKDILKTKALNIIDEKQALLKEISSSTSDKERKILNFKYGNRIKALNKCKSQFSKEVKAIVILKKRIHEYKSLYEVGNGALIRTFQSQDCIN